MICSRIYRRNPDTAEVEEVALARAAPFSGPATVTALLPGAAVDGLLDVLAGAVRGPDGSVLSPADGAAWVEALPASLTGSRLWAERTAS